MKIINKKKFLIRILELIVIIATIILTILAIHYATKIRGHKAYGGEYLILGGILVTIIEDAYQDSEKDKKGKK